LKNRKALLVGDNPFHNISHFSQERTRKRDPEISTPAKAADLIATAFENGANGFMFSVSETTTSILKNLQQAGRTKGLELYPIVPYAYEYVKLATQSGGIPGVAKKLVRQILWTKDPRIIIDGLYGALRIDVVNIMKSYVLYEISRVNSSQEDFRLKSLLLH
jgi:hypothetical protein